MFQIYVSSTLIGAWLPTVLLAHLLRKVGVKPDKKTTKFTLFLAKRDVHSVVFTIQSPAMPSEDAVRYDIRQSHRGVTLVSAQLRPFMISMLILRAMLL